MAEQAFTRCPSCKTIFRVTPQQLALRGGQVRCGHCHAVFDGVAALLSLTPPTQSERTEPELDEAALGPPTVTLRDARALEPALPEERPEHGTEPSVAADAQSEGEGGLDAEAAYAARFSWQEKRTRRRLPAWVYALAVLLLVLLLGAQILFHFGSTIAAYWPKTKPALTRVCASLRCQVSVLQEITGRGPCARAREDCGLSIEADVQADPAHKGLLILSATIRNLGPYPLAYPYLELTLSDVDKQTGQDVVVVRRAFSPQEYVNGTADLDRGIPGNGEAAIKLFVDASATAESSYLVDLFYP